ncbi:MAG: hypothetical protein GY943_38440 [Chloroflexi bacterium]|nr:hypothetical protein [Chloroflexota bacterium]
MAYPNVIRLFSRQFPNVYGILKGFSSILTPTSPTTTKRDKEAASRLGRWAFVGLL